MNDCGALFVLNETSFGWLTLVLGQINIALVSC